MKREYKDIYIVHGAEGDVQRITERHQDIGKYVVGVTAYGRAAKMRKVASTLNKMVRERGEEAIFKVVRSDGNYMVVRKLIPDDKLEFIDHALLDWEDVK
jgi:acetylglutamate kinase